MQCLSSFPRIRRFSVELGVSLILMIMMPLAACGGVVEAVAVMVRHSMN